MYKKILTIGETHHGMHLEEIKRIFGALDDIDKIFIELPVSHQSSVDEYIKTGGVSGSLKKLLKAL